MVPGTDRFLRACRREPVDRTPVWFMRQAGRYLPEYRELRGTEDILATCRDPARAVELTLQPLRRMDVDAAILFSDIMVPLEAIGVDVRIEPGVGPVIDDPIADGVAVSKIRELDADADVPHMLEAIRLLRKELDRPLIGFAGGPFTLASYLIEGGPSRDHARTKALLFGEPDLWSSLMRALVGVVLPFMRAQALAGAQALQLFDSWAGALSPEVYARSVMPYASEILGGLSDLGVPLIHFGVGTGELLGLMRDAGADVVGVDWRVPLDIAWERAGGHDVCAVQGNLDPVAVQAPWEALEREARAVLARAGGRDGHIFNLGHGVLPNTEPDQLRKLVDLVHSETERRNRT